MNIKDFDILKMLVEKENLTQRDLSRLTGMSLGRVNYAIKKLKSNGYLDNQGLLTTKAYDILKDKHPKRAVILAAGYGMRMVPISSIIPKALIEVGKEPLIERLIRQLHQVDIYDIQIVVGFRKEQFEYLLDKYHVELIINPEYANSNNLYSLSLYQGSLEQTYIVPADLWFKENPFSTIELTSWYLVEKNLSEGNLYKVNTKRKLVENKQKFGNKMIGLAYLDEIDGVKLKMKLSEMGHIEKNRNLFWEASMINGKNFGLLAKVTDRENVFELNTYEDLLRLDTHSKYLENDAIKVIEQTLKIPKTKIKGIEVLKKGMTNRSFSFFVDGKRYIMRIPGRGTVQLLNRKQEAEVYRVIADLGISDQVLYIDERSGYKISSYLENARVCNPKSMVDVHKCMQKLRTFHNLKLKVSHEFDIFSQIELYEKLLGKVGSAYRDYEITKKNILSLRSFIERNIAQKVLSHIDANPDNFLFVENDIFLIDWEYAGMQDPHIDIAMFGIYAMYDKKKMDQLIDLYFEGHCTPKIRAKIYCYVAACGLLWSNWCEYKQTLGVTFGEYSLVQYRYAKEFYYYATEMIKEVNKDGK
ncbi:phosphotransferase [Lactobacillus sp. AN1001]